MGNFRNVQKEYKEAFLLYFAMIVDVLMLAGLVPPVGSEKLLKQS